MPGLLSLWEGEVWILCCRHPFASVWLLSAQGVTCYPPFKQRVSCSACLRHSSCDARILRSCHIILLSVMFSGYESNSYPTLPLKQRESPGQIWCQMHAFRQYAMPYPILRLQPMSSPVLSSAITVDARGRVGSSASAPSQGRQGESCLQGGKRSGTACSSAGGWA